MFNVMSSMPILSIRLIIHLSLVAQACIVFPHPVFLFSNNNPVRYLELTESNWLKVTE